MANCSDCACAHANVSLLRHFYSSITLLCLKQNDLTACVNGKAADQSANSRCLIRIFLFTHIQFKNPREMGTKENNSDLSEQHACVCV